MTSEWKSVPGYERLPLALCFEIHERNGKVYRIFADGRIEGFEDGAVSCNYIWPLLCSLMPIAKTKHSSTADLRQGDRDFPEKGVRSVRFHQWFLQMWRRLAKNRL